MRTFIVMIFLLALFLGLSYSLGLGTTMLILSAMYFVMAVSFTFKKEYYDKFFSFTNPKYLTIADEKGEKFKKKNRITNIISYYMLSFVMFFSGILNVSGFKHSVPLSYFLKLGIVVFVIGIILYFVNNFLLKKSKKNSEYLLWSILLGVVLAIISISTITILVLR